MKGYKISWTSPCGMDGQSTSEYFFFDKGKAIKKFREIIKKEIENKYISIFDTMNEEIKYYLRDETKLYGRFAYYYNVDLTKDGEVENMCWIKQDNFFFKNFITTENWKECCNFLMKIGESKFTNNMLIVEITINEIEIEE